MASAITISVFVFWVLCTIPGVLLADHDDGITATIFFPLCSLLAFYNIAFRMGPAIFNHSVKDDRKVTYADLLVSIVVWVLSVGNLLFLVWVHDREQSFLGLESASVSRAWLRLNFSSILLSCGIGQGVSVASSLEAEGVLAYLAAITYAFVAVYVGGVGVAVYRAAIQQKDVLYSK